MTPDEFRRRKHRIELAAAEVAGRRKARKPGPLNAFRLAASGGLSAASFILFPPLGPVSFVLTGGSLLLFFESLRLEADRENADIADRYEIDRLHAELDQLIAEAQAAGLDVRGP